MTPKTVALTTREARDPAAQPGHGGDLQAAAARAGVAISELSDFSASINPLGPPEWLRREISRAISDVAHYPEPRSATLRRALGAEWGLPEDGILFGNGLNELIHALPRLVQVQRVLIVAPAYIDYARAATAAGRPVVYVETASELAAAIRPGDLVFLGHPGNPTGEILELQSTRELIETHSETLFAIDEAFLDFIDTTDSLSFLQFVHAGTYSNLAVLRSFTKFYAIPGLRLGCVVAQSELIESLSALVPDWSVNLLAQRIGPRLLKDREYAQATRAALREYRAHLISGFASWPGLAAALEIVSGRANYLLLRLRDAAAMTAREFAQRLLVEHRVMVRTCDNFEGLGGADTSYLRVAVRSPGENEILLHACQAICAPDSISADANAVPDPHPTADRSGETESRRGFAASRPNGLRPGPAGSRPNGLRPALMLQGTSSNAGKSVMTAAFCRIFLQDGLRVAPFKSQNMSLNSYVTADGREIARAQAVQAAACRLAPDIRMSPVLLKPGSETGSQVLVSGRPVGHMSALEYQSYKAQAFDVVREHYESLCADYDVIVLEGAGSPGEVNLKQNDIVNMRMAEFAQAAVLLVGDIDRGGVFAGFVGTLEVLAEWERRLVIGYLVNRFRGDRRLLGDAFEYMREHTGLPVLGVVPYLHGHGLPEEDSVTFKEDLLASSTDAGGGAATSAPLEIVFVDLPRVSNFTDVDALRIEPDVRVRVLPVGAGPDQLGTPDAVILPGTKNSLADLDYLKQSGIAGRLRELAARDDGPVVCGICGGFQMLGRIIRDPDGVESDRDTGAGVPGLGLLPLETEFAPAKTLRQTRLTHRESGLPVVGYEVHHGRTYSDGGHAFFTEDPQGELGLAREDGRVWGTYLHGVFDQDEFRRRVLDGLRTRRGLAPLGTVQASFDLEPAFERLAAAVRENVQLDEIYRKMGL